MTTRCSVFFPIIFGFLTACAHTAPPGIREPYLQTSVSSIAIAPVFSIDTFGLTPSERAVIHRALEDLTAQWLERAQVTPTTSTELVTRLEATGHWPSVSDAWLRNAPLTSMFEDNQSAFRGAEIEATRHYADQIGTQTVLFIEVLYQSDVQCARDLLHPFTPYAASLAEEQDTECVITHLEGKLVETRTGQTIWHNRALVEHGNAWSASTRHQALRSAVNWLLGSSTGILPLLTNESAPSVEASATNPTPES